MEATGTLIYRIDDSGKLVADVRKGTVCSRHVFDTWEQAVMAPSDLNVERVFASSTLDNPAEYTTDADVIAWAEALR
jgi:hypothetical protein